MGAGRTGGGRASAMPACAGASCAAFRSTGVSGKRRVRRGQVITLMYSLRKYRNTGSIRWLRPQRHLFILASVECLLPTLCGAGYWGEKGKILDLRNSQSIKEADRPLLDSAIGACTQVL